MKRLTPFLFAVLFAVLAPAAAAAPQAEGTEARALFLVVLQPLAKGQEPFDVTRHGGSLEAQHGRTLAVMLPESAVEGVRSNPRVRYLQRAVVGRPARTSSPPTVSATVASHASPPLTPRTDACAACTIEIGPYSYDGSGNITAIGTGNAFRYDGVSRLRSAGVHDGSRTRQETYTYDVYGNLTSLVNDGVTIDLPVEAATNRLSSTLGLTYDATGNVTQSPVGVYAYNQGGMIKSVDNNAYYIYTADDERIAMFDPTSEQYYTQQYTWTLRDAQGKLVRTFESFGDRGLEYFLWTQDHFSGGGTPVAARREEAEGGLRHFHVDHLGTPRVVTNSSGQQISAHTYLPFGVESTSILQERARGYEHEEPLRFTGHERDGLETYDKEHTVYLDYMHARHYNPNWGRFLSVDPVLGSPARPQTWNRYTYVSNNPVNYVDPYGLTETAFRCTETDGYKCYQETSQPHWSAADLRNIAETSAARQRDNFLVDAAGWAARLHNPVTGLTAGEHWAAGGAGLLAFVDGAVPFGDPVAAHVEYDDGSVAGLEYSLKAGEYTRNLELALLMGGAAARATMETPGGASAGNWVTNNVFRWGKGAWKGSGGQRWHFHLNPMPGRVGQASGIGHRGSETVMMHHLPHQARTWAAHVRALAAKIYR